MAAKLCLVVRIVASLLRYIGCLNINQWFLFTILSSCPTNELSIVLTFCPTAIKNHVIK